MTVGRTAENTEGPDEQGSNPRLHCSHLRAAYGRCVSYAKEQPLESHGDGYDSLFEVDDLDREPAFAETSRVDRDQVPGSIRATNLGDEQFQIPTPPAAKTSHVGRTDHDTSMSGQGVAEVNACQRFGEPLR